MNLIQNCDRLISGLSQRAIIFVTSLFRSKGKILMLHSVGGNNDYDYNISVEAFEILLRKLSQQIVVRLENWEASNDFYAITADDVHESFYLNAFPLLKQYNLPFTIFVATSLIGEKGYISFDQLKEMSDCPLCTVGSHGVSHHMYQRLDKDAAFIDLRDSKRILSDITGTDISLFAFPYGSVYACGFRNQKIVKKFYKYGFGTVATNITGCRLLPKSFLPRINVDGLFIENLL